MRTRFYATVPTLPVRLGCTPRLPLHQQGQNHDLPTGPATLMTVPTTGPAVPGVHALQASGVTARASRMHAKTASAPAAPESRPAESGADRPSNTNDSADNRHAFQASGPMARATRTHAKTASASAGPESRPADRPSDTNDSADNRPGGSQRTLTSSVWTHGPRNSDARQDSLCTRHARTTARQPAQRLTLVSTTGPAKYA